MEAAPFPIPVDEWCWLQVPQGSQEGSTRSASEEGRARLLTPRYSSRDTTASVACAIANFCLVAYCSATHIGS